MPNHAMTTDRLTLLLGFALAVCAAACSESKPPGGSTGTGGAGTGTGGASGTGGAMPPAPDAGPVTRSYQTCPAATAVGTFNAVLEQTFTGLTVGQVFDKPEVRPKYKVLTMLNGCQLVQKNPDPPPCNRTCTVGVETCTESGCVALPKLQNVGTITLSGLKLPTLTLSFNAQGGYSNPVEPAIPHPGFDEGAPLTLSAAGGNGFGPFTATTWGVAAMQVPGGKLLVENDKPVTMTWTPPKITGYTRVAIDFTVNKHGVVDTNLFCEVPDTGSFTVDAASIKEIFKHGISGFPVVTLERRSVATVMVKSGCVEFMATSPFSRDIDIPGLISCGKPEDCPAGKMCADDLTCK